MSYGCEIRNALGQIQIDSTYPNFIGLTAAMSYYGDRVDGDSSQIIYTDLYFPNMSPFDPAILAMRIPGRNIEMPGKTKAGLWGVQFDEADGQLMIKYGIGINFNSFDFIEFIVGIPSKHLSVDRNYGMVVYNANGDIVFHNAHTVVKPLRFKNIYTIANPLLADCSGSTGNYIDITIPDERVGGSLFHQICPPVHQVFYSSAASVWRRRFLSFRKITNTTLRIEVAAAKFPEIYKNCCFSTDYITIYEWESPPLK